MNTDFPRDDPTAVYTFSVDKDPLVFHRHEGHRAITGISGSAGAVMKFSKADHIEAHNNATSFLEKMFIVEIPADSLFVLRFSGKVYHQFGPKNPEVPAFFAISVHTNESGGDLPPDLLAEVLAGHGNIPLLTDPIPDAVAELLKQPGALDRVEKFVLPKVS